MAIYMKFGNIFGDATQQVMNVTADKKGNDNREDSRKVDQALRNILGGSVTGLILGESGWIPLKDFKWNGTRQITNRAGNNSPQARASISPNLSEVTVEKDIDAASCGLAESFCHDDKGVDCTIVFVRTGDPGEVYLKYKLKNTLVQEVHWDARPEGAGVKETLKLNFTDIEMSVWAIDEENVAQAPKIWETSKQGSQQGGGHSGHGGGHGHRPPH